MLDVKPIKWFFVIKLWIRHSEKRCCLTNCCDFCTTGCSVDYAHDSESGRWIYVCCMQPSVRFVWACGLLQWIDSPVSEVCSIDCDACVPADSVWFHLIFVICFDAL
jgi:hypothetical protein